MAQTVTDPFAMFDTIIQTIQDMKGLKGHEAFEEARKISTDTLPLGEELCKNPKVYVQRVIDSFPSELHNSIDTLTAIQQASLAVSILINTFIVKNSTNQEEIRMATEVIANHTRVEAEKKKQQKYQYRNDIELSADINDIKSSDDDTESTQSTDSRDSPEPTEPTETTEPTQIGMSKELIYKMCSSIHRVLSKLFDKSDKHHIIVRMSMLPYYMMCLTFVCKGTVLYVDNVDTLKELGLYQDPEQPNDLLAYFYECVSTVTFECESKSDSIQLQQTTEV